MGEIDERNEVYDAFISYRHTPLDKKVAMQLHKLLESYKAPKYLGLKQRRLTRVFRDQEELPTSSDLANNIKSALERSRYLIVVCSPNTPHSRWVEEEIKTFIGMHGHDRVLAVLIDGEPQEAFPQLLLSKVVAGEIVAIEPLAADIRANTPKEMNRKLKKEVIRIMATLLGCRYDDLRQRHRERKIKRLIALSMTVAIGILIFGTFSTWQAIRLKWQVDETLMIQSQYMSEHVREYISEGNRLYATRRALELLPEDMSHPDRPYVEEAEAVLHEALYSYKLNDQIVGRNVLNHLSRVKHATLSTDGKYLLSEQEAASLTLWDMETGEPVWESGVGRENLYESGFLIGERTALIRQGNVLKCIDYTDVNNHELQWEIPFETERLKIVIAEDSKRVVVYENKPLVSEKQLYNIDLATGYVENQLAIPNALMIDLAISPDNRYIAFTMQDQPLTLVDLKTEEIRQWEVPEWVMAYVDFSSDSQRLVWTTNQTNPQNALDESGIVTVYDLFGEVLFERGVEQWGYDIVAFSETNPTKLVLISEGYMEIVNVQSGTIESVYITGAPIQSLVWQDEMLIVGCEDGVIRFFLEGHSTEVESYRTTTTGNINQLLFHRGTLILVDERTEAIKIYTQINDESDGMVGKSLIESGLNGRLNASGDLGVVYNWDNEVEVWDINEGKCIERFQIESEKGRIEEIAFRGEWIVLTTNKGNIYTFNPLTRERQTYEQGDDWAKDVMLSPDAAFVLSEDYSNIRVIEIPSLAVKCTFEVANGGYTSAVDDKGNVLSMAMDGTKFYSDSQEILLQAEPMPNGVIGQKMIVLWDEHTIQIVEQEKGTVIQEILWPGKVIQEILPIPDTGHIVVQSDDGSLYVVDAATGEKLAKIPLEIGENGSLIGCKRIEKDDSLIIKGEWFTLKVSGETYKVIWRNSDVLDVSEDGRSVLVRDGRIRHKGEFKIYPYYTTQDAIAKGRELLKQYWFDGE